MPIAIKVLCGLWFALHWTIGQYGRDWKALTQVPTTSQWVRGHSLSEHAGRGREVSKMRADACMG